MFILSVALEDYVNFYDLFILILFVSFIGSCYKFTHYSSKKKQTSSQVVIDVIFGTIIGFVVGHQLLFYETTVPLILIASLLSSVISIKVMDLLFEHVPELVDYILDKFFKKR